MNIYKRKYPYYDIEDVKTGLVNFRLAEEMPDPICLKGRKWEMVKRKIIDETGQLNKA